MGVLSSQVVPISQVVLNTGFTVLLNFTQGYVLHHKLQVFFFLLINFFFRETIMHEILIFTS